MPTSRYSEADMKIADPIFAARLPQIKWMKIYSREYGVGYSEMAILCLSPKASYHIPSPSIDQIVIPDGQNSAFHIDSHAWEKLVKSLNAAYTSDRKKLEKYENQFETDGRNYLKTAQSIARAKLNKLPDKELCSLYKDYQDKLFCYSVFAWTSFILNNFISEKAVQIIDKYISTSHKEKERQEIIDALFKPPKRAAILALQHQVGKSKGNLNQKEFNRLYDKYKWLSCLDIHNKPWTKTEFRKHVKSLNQNQKGKNPKSLVRISCELSISPKDMEYLTIANKFVYIKDARDDYRRQGVYLALPMFAEIAKRMGLKSDEITFLLEKEIIDFLSGKLQIDPEIIKKRKNGFVLYLDKSNKPVCLQGNFVSSILEKFHLNQRDNNVQTVKGMVACKGKAKGKAAIVKGVKDLEKVKKGYILVAVTTHPDYVPAMRIASAIVTDEGGITSHAAIVSREFGIPCIVGTKNATRMLKNGDLVEVDAINGIVTKI